MRSTINRGMPIICQLQRPKQLQLYIEKINDQFCHIDFPTKMKKEKESQGDQNGYNNFNISGNMIEKTRRIIVNMNETQRFQKARAHIYDALNYKHPRFESQSLTTPFSFKLAYSFQSSSLWSWLLFLSAYAYLCLAAIDSEYFVGKLVSEAVILCLFWIDNIIVLYCKSFDRTKERKRYSSFFYIKFMITILMTVDLIIFICLPCYDSRPIRPFRILRCMVPVLFDPQMRKCLISLASAYKDILVYLIFYTSIIVGYAFIGNKTLTFDPSFVDPNFPQYVDPYRSNYSNLSSMIFIVYVTATYDAYPDNQALAIQNQETNYIYFLVFVFLNMFLFSSIPGSLIYFRFKEKRSKIILIDEIRQHHSLLLAFVTLANEHSSLSIQNLINFLLFLYRYKIRYVEYIADICLKLDAHSKNSIQVNQFMQMSRIILENSALLPPVLDDFGPWISFRKYINQKLYFKQIASTWVFELLVSILILLAFINSIFYMSSPTDLVSVFDEILAWIFFVQLLIRIIAFGPELFFSDKWNIIDTILVVAGIGVTFTSSSNSGNVLLKIGRIFRISGILRIVSHSNYIKKFKFQLLEKLINIYFVLLQILPIILRFMPLFLFFFYIYGIIGMQIFYNFYDTKGVPAYNQYQQFSDFKSLQHSFYIMVQVLTEAGWSFVAMDHCWRAPRYFGYIMVFFCFLHITIVYILATLIRGVFWEVYVTVKHVLNQRSKIQEEEEVKQEELRNKTLQINEINKQIESNQYIKPKTIMRRDLIQNRIDEEIFRRLIKVLQKSKTQNTIGTGRKTAKRLTSASKVLEQKLNIPVVRAESQRIKMPIGQIEDIDEQDVQFELSQLLDKFLVDPIHKYHEVISTPKVFIDFIKQKFIKDFDSLNENANEDDIHAYPLYKQEVINFHVAQLKSMLGLQVSKRQQKTLIMQSLVEAQVISQQVSERLIKKKLHEKKFQIDTRGIMRKLFLEGTNEDLIQKLYTQYFSGLYGSSYKHINRLTLEPLLKLEAKLTYSLRNIMRYPQVDHIDFFEILTTLESSISKELLQKGSIFKYIFKLDYEGQIWFWIQCKKPSQDLKIHFMKNGVWCYFQQMHQKQVYYARDIFNWNFLKDSNPKECAQYIKKFFQTFEAFSFSLVDQQDFFEDDPRKYIYDLYIQVFNVRKNQRYLTYKLQIQKVMVVILSKQELRENSGLKNIQYQLSDIKTRKGQGKIDLEIDQNDQETFSKLKNLGADETERIVQNQGLPFSYIIDLMKEVKQVFDVSVNNLIYQTEKAFNKQYEQKKSENQNTTVVKNSFKTIEKGENNKKNTSKTGIKLNEKNNSHDRIDSSATFRDHNPLQDQIDNPKFKK